MAWTSAWRAFPALLLAAAAVGGGGCGGGSSVDPVAQAATATGHVPGARVAGSIQIQTPGRAQSLSMPIGGVYAMRAREGTLTVDFSRLAPLAGEKLGSGADARLDEVIVWPNIYMRAPFLTKQLPGGKHWIRLDVVAFSRQLLGSDPTGLGAAQDPTQQLQYLRATSGGVRNLGRERIRGVETTHYSATVDLRKYVDRVPASRRRQAEQGIDRIIARTGSSTYPVDVWIDARHLVRRVRQVQSQKTQTGQVLTLTAAVDFFDFGAEPKVTPPPAGDVVDITGQAIRRIGG